MAIKNICRIEIVFDSDANMYVATGKTIGLMIALESEDIDTLLSDVAIEVSNSARRRK